MNYPSYFNKHLITWYETTLASAEADQDIAKQVFCKKLFNQLAFILCEPALKSIAKRKQCVINFADFYLNSMLQSLHIMLTG